MIKLLLSLLFLQTIISTNLFAKNLDAHVHGVVHLDIATEKKQLLVMLKTPSESFLGFEYKAKTKQEKSLVEKVKNEWRKELLSYLGTSRLKDCKVEKSKWEQKFSGKSHSTIIAESYINCDRPLQGRLLEVSLKKNYSKIQSISLQLLREDGSVLNKKYTDEKFKINL